MAPVEGAGTVHVTVCYARPHAVFLKEIDVPAGTTIAAAIVGSGLQQACPEVDRVFVASLNRFARGRRFGWALSTLRWGWRLRPL